MKLITNIVSFVLILTFGTLSICPPDVSAQNAFVETGLKPVSTIVSSSASPVFKGIKIYPQEPFRFDFLLSDVIPAKAGIHFENENGTRVKPGMTSEEEYLKLIKYFMASLAVPEGDLWVNLSPYEKDRIVPDALGQTEMGVDLLAQDYVLKQLTASLMNPEGETGKRFWEEIYAKTYEQLGTTNLPIDTFNKVWIVPNKVEVFQNGDTAYVTSASLKVMLEEDYYAQQQSELTSSVETGLKPVSTTVSENDDIKQIIRSIILPIIEHEVNTGESFANLRQIFYSMILAKWYEQHFKNSVLGQNYVDHNTVEGIKTDAVGAHGRAPIEDIYDQYVLAYKQGAYDFLKEEYDPETQSIIPKRYFAGGFAFDKAQLNVSSVMYIPVQTFEMVQLLLEPLDRAMLNNASVDHQTYFEDQLKVHRFLFEEKTTLVMDLGTGQARFPYAISQSHPEVNVIGVDQFPLSRTDAETQNRYYVANALEWLDRKLVGQSRNAEGNLPRENFAIVRSDVQTWLDALPDSSVNVFTIIYPDQKTFEFYMQNLSLMNQKLREGGKIYIMPLYTYKTEEELKNHGFSVVPDRKILDLDPKAYSTFESPFTELYVYDKAMMADVKSEILSRLRDRSLREVTDIELITLARSQGGESSFVDQETNFRNYRANNIELREEFIGLLEKMISGQITDIDALEKEIVRLHEILILSRSGKRVYVPPTFNTLYSFKPGDDPEAIMREMVAGKSPEDYRWYRSIKLDFLLAELPLLLENIQRHYDQKDIVASDILRFYAEFWDQEALMFVRGNQSFWMNLINLAFRFGGMNPISHGNLDLKKGNELIEEFRLMVLDSNPDLANQFMEGFYETYSKYLSNLENDRAMMATDSEDELREMDHSLYQQSLRDAKDLVAQLNLGASNQVIAVGSGAINQARWNAGLNMSGTILWDRLFYEVGATVTIYEPDYESYEKWVSLRYQLNNDDFRTNVILPVFYEADFGEVNIQNESADVVVAMNLFGTPVLGGDFSKSLQIAENMVKCLKKNGVLIIGDLWREDKKITATILETLRQKGWIINEFMSSQTLSVDPWVAYRVEGLSDLGGIDLNNLNMQTSGEAVPLSVPENPAMMNQPIFGLTPKILHIGPVNVYQFLGLKTPEGSDSEGHADSSSPTDPIPELSFYRKE